MLVTSAGLLSSLVNVSNLSLAATEDDAVSTPTPDDYEYEIEDSLDNYDWAELVPTVLVYSFVLLLGISGNGELRYLHAGKMNEKIHHPFPRLQL